MQDLNRHTTPPRGWVFFQAQTNWWLPNPVSVTFNQAVEMIIRHRKANPAITAKHNLAMTFDAVANELESYTRIRLNIPMPPKTFPSNPTISHPSAHGFGGVAADIKRAAQGTSVVLDWLLSGGAPVEQELAEKRASVCVQCPRNVAGSWYTVAPAELIRSTLSERSDLKLETPYDDKLQSCDVCKCLMRLKVWTPLQFILDRTHPTIMAEFPKHCWIPKHDQ
jgi:hypothetical protein